MNIQKYIQKLKRDCLPTKDEIKLWAKTPMNQMTYKMAFEGWFKEMMFERAMLGQPIAIIDIENEGGHRLVEVRVSTAELCAMGYFDEDVMNLEIVDGDV